MTHCTVCGAAAREGAKFCTSCGARLMDTAPDEAPSADPMAEATDTTATLPEPTSEPTEATTPDTSDLDRTPGDSVSPMFADEPESTPADATARTWGPKPSSLETAAEAPVNATIDDAGESDFAASWPDSAPAEPAAAEPSEAPTSQEETVESVSWADWTPATDAPEPEPAVSESADVAVTTGTSAAWTPPAPDEVVEDDHHGASQWESWAPAGGGDPHEPSPPSDAAASVRHLLHDLANQIDRLISPASMASRDVDPDTLAGQLDRWSRPTPNSDDLLEVVQAVRKSPRDLDAVTRLADRAADLELLVRHYQAITGGAGQWASELRRPSPFVDSEPGSDHA